MHIGDNPKVDGEMPLRHGISSVVFNSRGSLIANMPAEVKELAIELRIRDLPDAVEDLIADEFSLETARWAFAWSMFLTVFVSAIKEYARDRNIDQIWFLGRDCETICKALERTKSLDGFPGTAYLQVSRRSLGPLSVQPAAANGAAQSVGAAATLAEGYLRQHLVAGTKRVLIVDVGWKGHLQRKMQNALSEIEIFGFYVSLEPRGRHKLGDLASTLLRWDTGVFNLALTEGLFGFRGDTCIGYTAGTGGRVIALSGIPAWIAARRVM